MIYNKHIIMMKKMNGHITKYLYYEKTGKSVVTVPRIVIDAENLNWKPKDNLYLVVKTVDGQKGIFLFKKEQEEVLQNKNRAQAIELEPKR